MHFFMYKRVAWFISQNVSNNKSSQTGRNIIYCCFEVEKVLSTIFGFSVESMILIFQQVSLVYLETYKNP